MGDFFDFENFSNSAQSPISERALIVSHQYLRGRRKGVQSSKRQK